MRAGHIIIATIAGAGLGWALWPVSGGPPWVEEVDPKEGLERLIHRAGPTSLERVHEALGILDPDDVLAQLVEVSASGLRVSHAGGDLEIPLAGVVGHAQAAGRSAAASAPERGPLAGLGIVIDPGHHGGAWSEVERRHFPAWAVPKDDGSGFRTIVTSSANASPPHEDAEKLGVIKEGDLNWGTARLLEERLAAAGAEVHLTRGPPPAEEFPVGAKQGFDADREARLWLNQARHYDPALRRWARLLPTRIAHLALEHHVKLRKRDHLFRLYNQWDLSERARLAAKVDADLMLSIHYNFARNPELNHVVVFMPGHKPEGELVTKSELHYGLARLVEGDLDVTMEIGRRVGLAMSEGLRMPPPPPFSPPPGTQPLWWPVDLDARLFARNLAILRRAPGPVLLLEGPFMNHPPEAARLLRADVEVDGVLYPKRTREYADAVERAIIDSAPLLRRRKEEREAFSPRLLETALADGVGEGGREEAIAGEPSM